MDGFLEEIGLTHTETKIYTALLDLGSSRVSDILKKAGINSGRVYDVLASLEKKGFVSKVTKKGVKYFAPSPPIVIKDFLEEKKQKISRQENTLGKVLPELMKKYSSMKSKTYVEVFVGINGMKAAYEIFFEEAKKDKELLVLGITKQINYPKGLFDLLRLYTYKRRKELRLKTKKILDTGAKEDKIWKTDKPEIRYLPLPTLTSTEILGDCILIQIFQQEPITNLIKSKQATEDFTKQFKLLWKKAKR
jgi:sugar-specific transcriptional regulator TrmB